ncbi:DUF192 domain-containing protein [Limimaricola pyoseonensis]|uniref:DUF192 domain-containing protein n=1 Tax=Limimaricola pyoseonensis TaxID=521013 RepID=A0A1G7GWG7_9RHOB|nr:DUF192 domain-containing protein [Limimaricola pyoseonensis]SDE92279.1 hypothetical protein SAMN04488567_2951 [Limimaricola pyoseonensis]
MMRIAPGLLAALMALAGPAAAAVCAEDEVLLRGEWGQARFDVEVADDDAERARGLMFVEEMPRMSGMLFVYDSPRFASFWMRNTLIPLDIIFAGADGRVRHVHEGAVPLDETPIPGGPDIQYVLEVNGGMAGRLGIAPGDTMRHPAIGSAATPAADPCD